MKTKPMTLFHAALAAALLASQPINAAAQATSPSELLEKGIYAEETKGDIDVAMTITSSSSAKRKRICHSLRRRSSASANVC